MGIARFCSVLAVQLVIHFSPTDKYSLTCLLTSSSSVETAAYSTESAARCGEYAKTALRACRYSYRCIGPQMANPTRLACN